MPLDVASFDLSLWTANGTAVDVRPSPLFGIGVDNDAPLDAVLGSMFAWSAGERLRPLLEGLRDEDITAWRSLLGWAYFTEVRDELDLYPACWRSYVIRNTTALNRLSWLERAFLEDLRERTGALPSPSFCGASFVETDGEALIKYSGARLSAVEFAIAEAGQFAVEIVALYPHLVSRIVATDPLIADSLVADAASGTTALAAASRHPGEDVVAALLHTLSGARAHASDAEV